MAQPPGDPVPECAPLARRQLQGAPNPCEPPLKIAQGLPHGRLCAMAVPKLLVHSEERAQALGIVTRPTERLHECGVGGPRARLLRARPLLALLLPVEDRKS